jgi:hypothetical protein
MSHHSGRRRSLHSHLVEGREEVAMVVVAVAMVVAAAKVAKVAKALLSDKRRRR